MTLQRPSFVEAKCTCLWVGHEASAGCRQLYAQGLMCCTRRLGGVHECGMAMSRDRYLALGAGRARDPGRSSWGYPSLAPAAACEKIGGDKKKKRLDSGIDALVSIVPTWWLRTTIRYRIVSGRRRLSGSLDHHRMLLPTMLLSISNAFFRVDHGRVRGQMSIQMTLLSSGPDFFSVYREHGAGRHLSLVPHLVHCKLARSSSHLTNLGRLPYADQVS